MSDDDLDDADLHSQLIEAQDKIRRELEILLSPSSIGGGGYNRQVIADLREELSKIEAILANH